LFFAPPQEIGRPHDRGASVTPQPQQIFIGGDNKIRPGLYGALEDAVVGLVLLHYVQGLRRLDEPGEPEDPLPGIVEPIAIPVELVPQNPYQLINDRLRNSDLNVAVNGHVQEPHAAELKGRYVNIGVEGALAVTILTPGFSDQSGEIGLGVAEPERLLAPIPGEFVQLPVRPISPQGIRRDLIGGSSIGAGRLIHRT
jgi:hypothetical protein